MWQIKNLKIGRFFPIFLLLLILALALFLRICLPWGSVFQDQVRYSADDGVYHMRLIENMLLGDHFPHRIYFDPFTYFPYGTYVSYAPLYDFLIAGFIWLVGLGHPTLELINKIAPFYPAALGTICVLVVYFIGKVLWGKWTGLLSAFFAAISSPFLFRSLLGATDHHQAEALFSSLAILFFILAIRNQKEKSFFFWSVLAGIGMALYFLVWYGALIFLFVIFLFLIFYYLLEYLSGRMHTWALQLGIIIFVITLFAISFFFGHPDIIHASLYNVRHVVALLGGIIVFLIVGFLGEFFKKRQINRFYLPLALLALVLVGFLAIKICFPFLLSVIIVSVKGAAFGVVSNPLARQLVAEMSPLTIGGAFEIFSCLFYLSLISLGLIFRDFIKKRKAEDLLLVFWFLAMIFISGVFPIIGQNRFSFYLSINIALFSSFLIVKSLRFAWQGISFWSQQRKEKSSIYIIFGSSLIIFNIIYFTFYPFPLNLIEKFPDNLPRIFTNAIDVASVGMVIAEEDWYKSLKWLRENTPDPGLDYYELYAEPPFNQATGKISSYDYPETAYGVLASWSFGNMITYYGHRLTNANNFQQGLGRVEIEEEKVEAGETTFFIEIDEDYACQLLSQMKTRYIITDFRNSFAYADFLAKPEWAENTSKLYYLEGESGLNASEYYDKSMAARLHFLDGRGLEEVDGEKIEIPALRHFKLVYESETTAGYIPLLFGSNNFDVKMIKIFEYVKGAKITGKAANNEKVSLFCHIKTNQEREFEYRQNVQAGDNGKFEFTVPYSTQKEPMGGQTKFSVFAESCKIESGKRKIDINISEKDVLEGGETEISGLF